MDKSLASILGGSGLPDEMVASLQEAFNKKVNEAREEERDAVRADFAARYEHDKSNLVEAMDRMLTDMVEKTEAAKSAEVAKLVEARKNYAKAIKEARKHYSNKLNEHVGVSKTFVLEKLAKEVNKLKEQKLSLVKRYKGLSESVAKSKTEMASKYATDAKKINEFIIKQVTRELKEFEQDKRALVETRVRLLKESKAKLSETQNKFVKEAAKKVDVVVTEHLKNEMKQLHEDLERNRQNMFGRRIFEAVASEYMTSYLAEDSDVRKVQAVLEAKDKELSAVKSKLDEATKALDTSGRRVKLAEDRAQRSRILSDLLSNLRGEKRAVMEQMLETTKTDQLKGQFDKLLPVVLHEGDRKKTVIRSTDKSIVNEKSHSRTVTGDKSNRLLESMKTEAEGDVDLNQEIAQVIRLAGIRTI
jgi:hypothetical protein